MKYHRVFRLVDECPNCGGKTRTHGPATLDKNATGIIHSRTCVDCGEVVTTIELDYDEFMKYYDAGEFD